MFDKSFLTIQERQLFSNLNTPHKIQDYLDTLAMNFSDDDPCLCPREVIQKKTAHCMEGALFAAAALWFHGHKPLLLDLTTTKDDEDHVIALFKVGQHWGAISKTNHAVLRYRDPIYNSVRELVMSYFNEYFLQSGKKTLRTFSKPFDLVKYSIAEWLTSNSGVMKIIDDMANSKHYDILSAKQLKVLRNTNLIEIRAAEAVEWKKTK